MTWECTRCGGENKDDWPRCASCGYPPEAEASANETRPPAESPPLATDHPAPLEKPRKLLLAGLMGLLGSGLGQLYNGQLIKGIIYQLVACVWIFGTLFNGVWSSLRGTLIVIGGAIVWWLWCLIDAMITAPRRRRYRLKTYNRGIVYIIATAVVVLGVGLTFSSVARLYYQSYIFPTNSMTPALLKGDHVVVDKVYGHRGKIKRGDVIVFDFPKLHGSLYIKRVIGLPGEKVELRGRSVFVNGQKLRPDWGRYKLPAGVNYGPVLVPPGHYLVLGDNRNESQDSRHWGLVPRRNIRAKVLFVYWSWGPSPQRGAGQVERAGGHIRWNRIGLKVR